MLRVKTEHGCLFTRQQIQPRFSHAHFNVCYSCLRLYIYNACSCAWHVYAATNQSE